MRTRVAGGLLIAGGALAWIGIVLPPAASGSEVVIGVLGTAVIATGVVMVAIRRRLSDPVLGVIVALGTIAITVSTREGGGAGTGTEDNEMLYLWVALYSFYFFRPALALAQMGVVAGSYAWLLSTENVTLGEGATRWTVTVTTLLIGGLVVLRLRGSVRELVAELTNRARRDALTGLLNREGLEQRAELELARSRREGTPVAVIVIDVDGFKAINDGYGHPAGDRALARVAELLAAELRVVDAVARVGGDEFTVLLPNTDRATARVIAERLRRALNEVRDFGSALTLSLGIAVGRGGRETFDELWRTADRAMYEAKRAGGDGVRDQAIVGPSEGAALTMG
jgi:diguanylate cyclase (GGDEF)-like protein